MDWSNRNEAVLFGDGAAAVVLQASDTPSGVIGTVLGCDAEARQTLRVRGMGCSYVNSDLHYGDALWDFDGQAIFKRAVHGMSDACGRVMATAGVTAEDIDLVVPHQANLRIIEAVAKYAGVPMERVMLTVQRYGNMSAATVPVSLVDAIKEGRVKPGSLILMPGFGGGLTFGALLVRWGSRVTPLGESEAQHPPLDKSALEMVNAIRARQDPNGRSKDALMQTRFIETQLTPA
jgi:3-oxoacyl-[acyl-carrier-protein] synthase-3